MNGRVSKSIRKIVYGSEMSRKDKEYTIISIIKKVKMWIEGVPENIQVRRGIRVCIGLRGKYKKVKKEYKLRKRTLALQPKPIILTSKDKYNRRMKERFLEEIQKGMHQSETKEERDARRKKMLLLNQQQGK